MYANEYTAWMIWITVGQGCNGGADSDISPPNRLFRVPHPVTPPLIALLIIALWRQAAGTQFVTGKTVTPFVQEGVAALTATTNYYRAEIHGNLTGKPTLHTPDVSPRVALELRGYGNCFSSPPLQHRWMYL